MPLSDDQIEALPHDRNKVETCAQRYGTEGDAAIGASRSNGLGNIRPGRAWWTDAHEAIDVHFSTMEERLQQQLRTGAWRTYGNASPLPHHVINLVEAEWISLRNNNSLFAACEANQNGIMKIRSRPERFHICVNVLIVYCMQVYRGRDKLALDESIQSCIAALWQSGEAGSAFAQRPFQQ